MQIKPTRYGICLPGFRAAGVKREKYGLTVILADELCKTAAVFTKNSVQAGPVIVTKKIFKKGLRAIIANSGNANCCTQNSVSDAKEVQGYLASKLGVEKDQIGIASTGIIGRDMNVELVKRLTDEAVVNLSSSSKASIQSAKAIMTTDTRIKMYSAEYEYLKVGGICKGAGMIAPQMATMLCFLTTDIDLSQPQLQKALQIAADESFNMISVDGDMSTNDTLILMSSSKKSGKFEDFVVLLTHVCQELAKMIARDGEGAKKFFEVQVSGTKTKNDAVKAVKSIINSPLVKCAIHGENPNWGRIISSVGSVVKVDQKKIVICFRSGKKDACVFSHGRGGNLENAAEILKKSSFEIIVDLGIGKAEAVGWGCDMSAEYVKINADYS